MSKARAVLEQKIIEAAKKTTTTAQQRVIEIGTLLSKLEDTIVREREEREEEIRATMLPRSDFQTVQDNVNNARKLLCDLWMSFPAVRSLVGSRTGRWFAFGCDRDTDYEGKDLSGTPAAAKESGPSMILSKAEINEVFEKVGMSIPANLEIPAWVIELLEKAWNKGTPSSRWKVLGEEDPHKGHYDTDRSALTLGRYTDDELANGAFLNYDAKFDVDKIIAGTQIAPISWMTGVKDRIRWLSRHLDKALANAKSPQDEAILGQIDKLKAGERLNLYKPVNGDKLLLELGNTDFREVMGLIPSKEIVVNRASLVQAIGTEDIEGWFEQRLQPANG